MKKHIAAICGGIAALLLVLMAGAQGQTPPNQDNGGPAVDSGCTSLLRAHDAKSVEACKAQLDQAESAPSNERMVRIVANDEYGVALLAFGHKPKEALDAFNHAIALLPDSTVKPDTLQWAVAYWHRATAFQQLGESDPAAKDLSMAERSLSGAMDATGDTQQRSHLEELRKRVLAQHATLLEQQGKPVEAQHLLTTH